MRCVNGKARLSARRTQLISTTFVGVGKETCEKDPGYCDDLFVVTREHLLEHGGGPDDDFGALSSWRLYIIEHNAMKRKRVGGPACETCINALCEREEEQRRQVWAELPGLMGISVGGNARGREEARTGDVDASWWNAAR